MFEEISLQLHSIFDYAQIVSNYIIIEMRLTELYSS